jgi:hypothetical protein
LAKDSILARSSEAGIRRKATIDSEGGMTSR